MIKRDELRDPESCLNRAGDDEMLFVLLGRDVAAPKTILVWIQERLRQGKNVFNDKQIADAVACAYRMCEATGQSYFDLVERSSARSIDGKFATDGAKIFNMVSGEEIPRDEPLFVLRARDMLALDVLRHYEQVARERGCNDLHLAGMAQVINKFEKYKAERPERMKQPGITRHLKLEEVKSH